MRLERLPSPYSGSLHRPASLDFRISRRHPVRPPVVVPPGGREPQPPLLHSELFPDEAAHDRKLGRWALCAALVFHAVMLFIVWPQLDFWPETERPERIRTVYVIQPTRYQMPSPPPPAGGQPQVRKRRQLIPVPDLTPDLPEPVLVDLPEIDFSDIKVPIDIPPGPGGPAPAAASAGGDGWAAAGQRHGAQTMTGDIVPPVRLHGPQPNYTEAARLEKLEGFVIVEIIVDTEGNVVEAKIRKGMPLGLSKAAVEAVMGWKFQPATRNGQPVAVYFVVSMAFRLQ